MTPKRAEQWLNKNVCNRNMRAGVAERYAADMARGSWTECTAPIAFYEDGELADGQHRLYAIVESGTTQSFIIARGVTREAGLNIDTGASRSVVDNARISGSDPGLTTVMVSCARAIHEGVRQLNSRSNAQKLEVVEMYRAPAEFCNSHSPRVKFLSSGPMLGAIGRAFMHEADKERLLRFCSVLRTGMMNGDDESAAVALRNYLTMKGASAGAGPLWVDTFWKAQNAIYYFMRRKPLHLIRTVKAEAYPLIDPKAKPLKGQRQQRTQQEQRAA